MTQEPKRRYDRVANDLREVISTLFRRLRAESADQALSMSQVAVVVRLHKGGPAAVADLARAEQVTAQWMGATVASLEKEGLVARKPDPEDARRWNVFLTDVGERMFLAGRAARQAWLTRALEVRLDEAELRRVADALVLLRKVLAE